MTEDVDADLKSVVTGTVSRVNAKMDDLRVADAISEIFTLFKRCNKYIDETMPWALAKDEAKSDRLKEVLYNLTEAITIGASLLESFLPETAEKIVRMLNTQIRELDKLDQFGLYESGTTVTATPEILFARIDIKDIMPKVEAIQAAQRAEYEEEQRRAGITVEAPKKEAAPDIHVEMKDQIEYDDFGKMQFVVGEIVACEEVKKSKKLLCSQVKIGDTTKQIVSGIKAWYKPEEMVGKKVMVLLNLKPATLAGVVSEGMILCAEDAEGNLCVMSPEKDLPSGSGIS